MLQVKMTCIFINFVPDVNYANLNKGKYKSTYKVETNRHKEQINLQHKHVP